MQYKSDWLPQLKDSIPAEAQRNNISMYSIALEGWRRGISVTFYKDTYKNKTDIKYALRYKNKEHHFYGSCGDLNTEESISICDDKYLTKTYLNKFNVPVPKGKLFDNKSKEDIAKYVESIGYPVVIKPIDESGGKGVFVNLRNEKELLVAIERYKYDNLLVEKFISGEEVRVYVLNNRIIGAVNRKPANVVGDGVNTVKKLIELKNQERKKIPHLKFRPIKIDREVIQLLKKAGYTLESIPETGKCIVLRKTSNVSMGGDPVEITEELTDEMKNIAIAAQEALPGLTHCGVDMIVDKEQNKVVVLEVNARPGIGSHLFPFKGKAKDIPRQLINFYFPETKHIITEHANVYFDFGVIKDGLLGSTTEAIELKPPPSLQLYVRKYSYESEIDPLKYVDWIRKKVYENNLNGFIRKNGQQIMELVLASDNEKKLDEFIKMFQLRVSKRYIKNFKEHNWDLPVKCGFELMDGLSSMNISELAMQLEDEKKEINKLAKDKERYKKQILKLENSTFWKITSFIRNVVK